MSQDRILMSHGAGGLKTYQLIKEIFHKHFANPILTRELDAGLFPGTPGRWAMTTDSFVVKPLFFPGGDIGKLSVCGTVNDLAVSGAKPLYLTSSFILEEGLPLIDLEKIVASMAHTAREAGVQIVAGDTKVVEKGSGDGVFITTTGLGLVPGEIDYSPQHIQPGDKVIISGPLGQHGLTIMAARGNLPVTSSLVSDCACLHELLNPLHSPEIRCMRDPTRGGLATTLNELALQSGLGILLEEGAIPRDPAVEGLADLLGLDSLYLANEGKAVVIASPQAAPRVLAQLRNHPLGRQTSLIGEVTGEAAGQVLLQTDLGTKRVLRMPAGELLPRIC
ncbi:MAG: hypE [Peptococcaceae bacterium]|jgi:hydrogenase expression/formation protein HypE|nr:hypE [Peptococcaceae bacterium]